MEQIGKSTGLGLAAACLIITALPAFSDVRESLAGEAAAQELKAELAEEEYNIQAGPVKLRSEASLNLEWNDNVFRSDINRRDDVILTPELRLDALWPVTDLNALRLSLGVGYNFYFDHSELNSDAPLVSPDSELAWHIYTGDFHIKLRNRFSYQETLYIGSISTANPQFINFNDVGQFRRLDNLTGFTVDWDLNDVILSAGYDHEYFNSFTDRFEYMDRQSELFSASAKFFPEGKIVPGVEVVGGAHNYDDETVLHDHWRVRTGPFVEGRLSDTFQFRAGAGYDTAEFSDSSNSDYDTYYAYGQVRHVFNRFLSHAFSVGRETELGYNADNVRTTYLRYRANWRLIEHVDIGTRIGANWAREFGGAYHEEFTYFPGGVNVSWQFHKHWRAVFDYAFIVKDSDLPLQDFYQNRVSVAAVFQF